MGDIGLYIEIEEDDFKVIRSILEDVKGMKFKSDKEFWDAAREWIKGQMKVSLDFWRNGL